MTAEVTPHHLLLTDELVASYDPVYKVNPPLRTAADVAALRGGPGRRDDRLRGDRPRPHPLEDKETEWAAAAFGMTGLETALRVVQEAMVETGLLDWAGRRRPDVGPARRDRAAGRPRAAAGAGSPASLTLYDPEPREAVDPRGTRPGAATRRSRAGCCRDGWSPRSCAAAPDRA